MSSYRRVLRLRDFRNLFLGQSASAVGDQAVIVALALYITRRTGSASDLGFVLAAQTAPMIALLLLGGVWADRLDRRRIMIGSDAARAALHGAVAALILAGGASVGELIVAEALFGVARAFFQPAYTGLLPETLDDDALVLEAQALTKTASNLAILIGPAIGTVLVLELGAGTAFALDAATFVVSALLLARVHPRPRSHRDGAGARDGAAASSVLAELREGFAEVRSRPWVWATIGAFTVVVLCGYATWYSLAPLVAHQLYGRTSLFGVLETVAGAGAFAGALLGVRLRPRRSLFVGIACIATWSFQLVAFALHAPVVFVLALVLVAGVGGALFDIWWETALVRHIPPRALSRVSSYDWMGSLALLPVGFALAGPLGDAVGARWVLGAGGVISFLALGAALLPRSTRELVDPGAASAEQPDGAVAVEAGGEPEIADVDPLVRPMHERRRV